MARSELGRRVQRLAEEHRTAAGISRRDFLGYSTAAAGALVVATSPIGRLAGKLTPATRIAIVGAGISGLSAALRLQDSGIAATVYEASPRVGGRMSSDTTSWRAGQISEWGGELVDTDHKVIRALAARFDCALDNVVQAQPNGSQDTFFFDGRYYPYAQASNDFQAVHQAIQTDLKTFTYPVLWNNTSPGGIALSNLSLYDWIETRVPGGHASAMGQLLDVAYNIEFGAETTDQTALNLLGLLGFRPQPGQFALFGSSDERDRIRGGADQLPRAIATSLPSGSTKLGWRLDALVANADRTQTLTFFDGSRTRTVVADHTILALPLGVLQRLDLRKAGFDPRKTAQIAAMRMGHNTKLQLQFDSRVWSTQGAWPGVSTGQTFADTGYQSTWDVSRAQPGAEGLLVDYSGGDVATAFRPAHPFATQTDSAVRSYAAAFLRQIEPVLPGLSRQWNGRATLAAWHLDPLTYGAYAYCPVGYMHRYAGYEAVRQGNVHFAGEHCSIDFQGYMEGGAREGQRAAVEVLSDLGRK